MIPQFEPTLIIADSWAVARQVMGGWVGPGDRVQEFEKALAAYWDATGVVATSSGTVALLAMLHAHDLPAGSTVLCPGYTHPAGANLALMMGHKVRFVDITPSLCMDCAQAEEILRKDDNVSAIVNVRHNGLPLGLFDTDSLKSLYATADERGVAIIHDECQAMLCKDVGGTYSSAVSFSAPKPVTTGQGGAVAGSPWMLSRVYEFIDRGGGWRNTGIQTRLGGNFRMTDMQAALGLSQLSRIDWIKHRRKDLASVYRRNLSAVIAAQLDTLGCYFLLRCDNGAQASRIMDDLQQAKIRAPRLYRPMSHHKCFAECEGVGQLPVAEKMYQRTLYLPCSLHLRNSQIKTICRIIEGAWN